MIRSTSRRLRGLAVLIVAAGLIASGCGQVRAGAAALVGNQRITVEELAQSVRAIEQAAARSGLRVTDRAALVRGVLSQQITNVLIDEAAERNGITVSRSAVQQRIAQLGGRRQLQMRALRRAVPPQQVDAYVQRQIIALRLVQSQGIRGGARARQTALLRYLRGFARSMPITVNPRYGQFNANRLAVIPEKTALSTPDTDAPGNAAGAGLGGAPAPRSGG